MTTEKDLLQLEQKGISEAQIQSQLARFEQGFPHLRLHSVATVGNGIVRLSEKDMAHCMKVWREYQQDGASIEKFVPASGAASRMFKNMFAFASRENAVPESDFEQQFFNGIDRFAFFYDLNKMCLKLHEHSIRELVADGRYVDVVKTMLGKPGLNYGFLPKALLKFHKATGSTTHTALEEHLEEGAQYAVSKGRVVNLHFTVSPEHRQEFHRVLSEALPMMEMVWGVKYNVTMSEQKPLTDTIAVTTDNAPYRDADGNLFFRPAGHGALLQNLNERDAAVVFVKNIDNVVPLRLRAETTRYKKVLAGYLIDLQRSIARRLTELNNPAATPDLKKTLRFVENRLSTHNPATAQMTDDELRQYLIAKLNRPIRVCGMVPNEGEPGGGPYLAYNADGSYSPQILEAAQINPDDPAALEMMKSGTHFNPVDLVCYLRDYKGDKFDLMKYVDHETGLISMKSVAGVDIKALELPGLWNGSMSDWNTVFVEVPLATFNPVKTVNDLLRPQHQ